MNNTIEEGNLDALFISQYFMLNVNLAASELTWNYGIVKGQTWAPAEVLLRDRQRMHQGLVPIGY